MTGLVVLDDKREVKRSRKAPQKLGCRVPSMEVIQWLPENVCLSQHLDLKYLKAELDCLPAYLRLFNECNSSQKSYKRQHHMWCHESQTILKDCPAKRTPPSYHHSVTLYSSTDERTYSVMRRVMTWLRFIMTVNSLTNKKFATIHRYILDDLHIEKLVNELVSSGCERRKFHITLNHLA